MSRKKLGNPLIKGTYYLSQVGGEIDEVRELIQRRRLQLLVHSYIYYRKGESLISDDIWTQWAKQLYKLQKKYPHIAKRVDYHKEFKDFDPSTGMNLPYNNPEIINKGEYLLRLGGTKHAKTHKTAGNKLSRTRKANKRPPSLRIRNIIS